MEKIDAELYIFLSFNKKPACFFSSRTEVIAMTVGLPAQRVVKRRPLMAGYPPQELLGQII